MAEKIYRCALTPRAWALVGPSLVVALLLIATGVGEQSRFSSQDPARFLLVHAPIVFGLILLGLLGLALKLNLRRTVVASRAGLRVAEGGKEAFSVRWARLSYAESDRFLFRVLLLSDGARFLHLVDLFYPDFGALLEELHANDRLVISHETPEQFLL